MGFVYDEDEETESDPARRGFAGSWTNHVEEIHAGSPSEVDEVNV